MSSLKQRLADQQEELESIKCSVAAPNAYLATVNPALEKLQQQNGSSATSPASSPNATMSDATALVTTNQDEEHSPSRLEMMDAPTADAYVEGLGQMMVYGDTSRQLNLRVTDTLELALRVLKRNAALGGSLTTQDVDLLADINSFACLSDNTVESRSTNANAVEKDAGLGVREL